jgi:hypothetical protein
VSESNGKKDIPVHIHLFKMQEYSRFVRFLFLGRKALHRLMVRHGLNKHIDLEDFFITSIVHSTDHFFLVTSLEPFNLNYASLTNEAWSNLLVTLFYSPLTIASLTLSGRKGTATPSTERSSPLSKRSTLSLLELLRFRFPTDSSDNLGA